MRLIFSGKGSSGSWAIRGDQLGAASGGTVKPMATAQDFRCHDMAFLVKRVPDALLEQVRKSGINWVLDCLDFFPQPHCTSWTRSEAVAWIKAQVKSLSPAAVVWPNRKMREDCDDGLPGLVLPHHHRPGIAINPVRPTVQTVGYEGAAAYLGNWRETIEAECAKRNWHFVVNPARLADLDIVVAVRSVEHSGYAQFHYKSNVKLANAHGSGTPFIGQRECGYLETATGCEYWADEPKQLGMCFDWMESQETRELISDRFREAAYPVEQAAKELKAFLETVK